MKRLALDHVSVLERKIRELQEMASTLKHLARTCHGDGRPQCPILEELANDDAAPAPVKTDAKFGALGKTSTR